MLQVMLAQQVLPEIVAVRRSDDGVDMRAVRHDRIHKVAEADRALVIELDQDHRTLDAVVEHAAGRRLADPRQPCQRQEREPCSSAQGATDRVYSTLGVL